MQTNHNHQNRFVGNAAAAVAVADIAVVAAAAVDPVDLVVTNLTDCHSP
jgi:hypothetical protein